MISVRFQEGVRPRLNFDSARALDALYIAVKGYNYTQTRIIQVSLLQLSLNHRL